MGSPDGWNVFPAQLNIPQQGPADLSKLNRAADPSYQTKKDDTEKTKDENEGMLYADKLYYLQSQNAIDQQEKSIRGEMYNFFYNGGTTPDADTQSGWNKRLSDIENSKMQIKAQESSLKDRRTQFNALRTSMDSGGEKATSNRIAVINDNGVYTAVVGQKDTGGYGWMDQSELLDANQGSVGIGKNGVPHSIIFPTTTGYTGDFNKYFQTIMKGGSKDLVQNSDGSYSTNAGTITGEDVGYMQELKTSTDAGQLYKAANAMWTTMPPTAKSDLMSTFHEMLARGKANSDGTFTMPLDHADGKKGLVFDANDAKILNAYRSGQQLSADQKDELGNIQEKYGRQMIYSMVPGATQTTQSLENVKTSGDPNAGGGTKGTYTRVALGEQPTNDAADIIIKKDNAYSQAPGRDTQTGEIRLHRWDEVNPTNVTAFNEKAVNYLKDEGGLVPSHFTGGQNWYYSGKGVPQSMSLLENNHVSVIGVTGRIQENYAPTPTTGKDGEPTFDVPDVKKVNPEQLNARKVKTIQVNFFVPDDDYPTFRKQSQELYGLKTDNISKDDFKTMDVNDPSSGKKVRGGYIIPGWLPTTDESLAQIDNPTAYGKGTAKAIAILQAQKLAAQAAQVKNITKVSSY